jgi:hypothetical protein
MTRNIRRGTLAIGVAFIAFFGAACSSSDEGASNDAGSATTTTEQMTTESSSDSDSGMADSAADPAADLVGPGCAGYAQQVPDGAGSVAGMAADPVAVAASNNPLLTTLVSAVSGKLNPNVNLVDTLNGGEFTVFAPVDDAFAKIDAATIDTLKTDSDLLTPRQPGLRTRRPASGAMKASFVALGVMKASFIVVLEVVRKKSTSDSRSPARHNARTRDGASARPGRCPSHARGSGRRSRTPAGMDGITRWKSRDSGSITVPT